MSEVDDKDEDHVHNDIGCLDAIEALYAYIDGEIEDESSIEAVESHMAHCRSCYSRTEVERRIIATRHRPSCSHGSGNCWMIYSRRLIYFVPVPAHL
jgi:anti-sigma factor RsiW